MNSKRVLVDSVFFDADGNQLEIHFNKALAEMPVREGNEELLMEKIRAVLPSDFSETKIDVFSNGVLFRELIPSYSRKNLTYDTKRLPQKGMPPERKNVVEPVKPYSKTNGLENANIVLWNSHGWYYESKLDRWEWQHARLFTTLEDILPTSLVVPFIAPMLENAGANIFITRERDWQINEVIADNDASTGKSKFRKPKNRTDKTEGFAIGNPPYDYENPFHLGTLENFEGGNKENVVEYISDFAVAGDYAVYVSYGKRDGKVTYRVHHSCGINDFVVDQSMGFGTWIYLGKFNFENGRNKNNGKVELITPKNSQFQCSADTVRLGSGLGQIVDDINAIYGCNWTRRGMWNAQYSEAYGLNVPTMLLELLSHQNFNDVRFMLHPKFKLDVSRAIYKRMLRYISKQNDYEYVVQLLPVDNVTSKCTNENTVELSWLLAGDPLEPTAKAEKHMVCQSEGSKGFDSGALTKNTNISIQILEKGRVCNFKITAINQGGESFPSGVISVGRSEKNKGDILIVNGFEIGSVCDQYDYDRSSPWLDDDSPGHGASYANLESNIFRGNTFDFSTIHGQSI